MQAQTVPLSLPLGQRRCSCSCECDDTSPRTVTLEPQPEHGHASAVLPRQRVTAVVDLLEVLGQLPSSLSRQLVTSQGVLVTSQGVLVTSHFTSWRVSERLLAQCLRVSGVHPQSAALREWHAKTCVAGE